MTKDEAEKLIAEIERNSFDTLDLKNDIKSMIYLDRLKKIINRFANAPHTISTQIYNYTDDDENINPKNPHYGTVDLTVGGIGVSLILNNTTEDECADMVLTKNELKQLRDNINLMLEYLDGQV